MARIWRYRVTNPLREFATLAALAYAPPAVGTPAAHIDTPSLVVDLDAMMHNLGRMAEFARKHNATTMVKGLRVIADFDQELRVQKSLETDETIPERFVPLRRQPRRDSCLHSSAIVTRRAATCKQSAPAILPGRHDSRIIFRVRNLRPRPGPRHPPPPPFTVKR